jgi:GR25 family glycosyltransferase involved in LPS biosynthesis
MRIGITVDIRHSMFSAGHPNSCIAIAEALKYGGHEVHFIKRDQDNSWWDDVKSLEKELDISICKDIEQISTMDLIIEVAFFLTPAERTKVKRTVWYCRQAALFTDLELTVFDTRVEERNLEGLSEIWVADIFNGPDDFSYLRNLYKKIPVKSVPWLWTPRIVETHSNEVGLRAWTEVNSQVQGNKWSLHISETNFCNSSSCTIPIVALQDKAVREKIEKIHVHNAEHLLKSEFFKKNILENCNIEGLNIVGRQRVIDWSNEPLSIILGHSRFIPLKMANLEAAWIGIPVVHNNTILRDLGCGLEKTYYEHNKVQSAIEKLLFVFSSRESIPYLNNIDSLTQLRKKIISRFSPEAKSKEWLAMLDSTVSSSEEKANNNNKGTYNMLFTDMWDQFNPAYNMFILAFRNCMQGVEVCGYSMETLSPEIKCDIHIFGPFGQDWRKIVGPKIHYTGENTEPILEKSVKLNMGFKRIDSPSYFRLPLWMLEIDWFQANKEEIRNPIPIPLESCIKTDITERKEFCAFIVSNPKNEIRNSAFHELSKYKGVSSAGRLFNNMGNKIFAGLGGGGGELIKHEFLKDYKFCLCYENESSEGYITEKLLHAKAAGCIPIYWGAPDVSKDFDERGFINITGCPETLVERVKEIDESKELYKNMASIPAINPDAIDSLKIKLNEMVRRILDGYLFVTFATKAYIPSLYRWLDAIAIHMQENILINARVYIGQDINDQELQAIKQKYATVTFLRVPIETPTGFDDFWDPKHYAWKLWICKEVSEDLTIQGKLVVYSDCASVLIRWPEEFFKEVKQHKICFLEDSTQINEKWCHEIFCSILNVTTAEKKTNHILAAIVAFISGDPAAKEIFTEAYELGCIREIIVGEKWLKENYKCDSKGSILPEEGVIYGHRHDQSILSILSIRKKTKYFPADKLVNHISARSAYFSGHSIYLHRGNYMSHFQVLPGIDDAFVVNLDRRSDRRASFLEKHPYLKGKVKRHVACDGISLTLTPAIASLFKPNDFFWKKAVMGCNISHVKLWKMLESEGDGFNNYLIMEDDVRLKPEWLEAWMKVKDNLPTGWECIYLGGVLPPNRNAFELIKEPVIPGLCRIKPNTLFGQAEPVRQFHFCTYSYIISKLGVKKILDEINKHGGIWTSADHILFNSLDKMNVYCMDPFVAGALQDDDPAYINSDFNNFSRKDCFDSDLWNNDLRFSSDEISACLPVDLDINEALRQIYQPNSPMIPRFVSLDSCNLTDLTIYEGKWLNELFSSSNIPFRLEQVSIDDPLSDSNNLIVFLQKPKWDLQKKWVWKLLQTGKTIKIVHCSDEFTYYPDPVDFYKWENVKGILRFYQRPDNTSHTLTMPLGYHWKNTSEIPLIEKRSFKWSFVGTDWNNRSKQIESLLEIKPNFVKYFPDWNNKEQLSEKDYIDLLLDSIFCPCPGGNNIETYRFYEALECGCIPVYTELPEILKDSNIPMIMKTETWNKVAEVMNFLLTNPSVMNDYHSKLMSWWISYKNKLKLQIDKWLLL